MLPEHDYREYQQQLNILEEKRAQLSNELVRVREQSERLNRVLVHPAELWEEIASTRKRISQLEEFRDALEIAQSEIERAAKAYQEQFAPRIEELVQNGLSKITRSRYSSVKINPKTLEVKVFAPELQANTPIDRLSTGTQDLVYLLLRVGIAQYMSRNSEPVPLLLDDPFVHFDQTRLITALEDLKELSKSTQILLFTMREDIQEWVMQNVSDATVHRLV